MEAIPFSATEFEAYTAKVGELNLTPCATEALKTRHAYKSYVASTNRVPIEMAGQLERESRTATTVFSRRAAEKIIVRLGASENPTEIHANIVEWSRINLHGLYTTLLPSKQEKSCLTMMDELLEDTAKVFNFYVSEGSTLSPETYTEAMTFCLKARKRLSVGSLNDYGVMLKGLRVWDFKPDKWVEIIRPELMSTFAPRINALHIQLEFREKYEEYKTKGNTILDTLHVYGAEPRLSYAEVFEKLMGFTDLERRIGLNELADSRNISASMLAIRFEIIRNMIKNGDEIELHREKMKPVEIERYEYLLRLQKRLNWQRQRTVESDQGDVAEQTVLLTLKLFEEQLFGIIIGDAQTYEWNKLSTALEMWLTKISSTITELPESVRKLFPPSSGGIQGLTLREIILKVAEETKSSFVSEQRTGVVLNDRLRAAELLADPLKLAEAMRNIYPFWYRTSGRISRRLMDIALVSDESNTTASSMQTILIIEALLEEKSEMSGFVQILMQPNEEILSARLEDYNDPQFVEKVSKAISLLANLVKPRGLEGRWKGLQQNRKEAAQLGAQVVTTESPNYLIKMLLYAQMQGYSVREVVRRLQIPPFMHNTIFSQLTELLRMINARPLSKSGRG